MAGATGERLQKYLAAAGLGSRREIDGWIAEGRVEVNGEVAVPGLKVGPDDRIVVDGRPLRRSRHREPLRVLLYKKRVGEVVTQEDPEGRRTVFRKLPKLAEGRWIAVGRLDINTSGMLLLTNHGELAHRLMHPSSGLLRHYAVRVRGVVDDDMLRRLRRGVELDDGPARFEHLQRIGSAPDLDDGEDGETPAANQWFEVALSEGRNRIVRRLWTSQGCEVSRLIRVGFGPLRLGRGIRSGSFRELERDELQQLLAAVELPMPARSPAAPRAAGSGRRPAGVSRPAADRSRGGPRRPPAKPTRR